MLRLARGLRYSPCTRRCARTDVDRVARIHRDPFELILPILESPSPVAEYLKIADESLKWRPDVRRYPRKAAEFAHSYLLIRFAYIMRNIQLKAVVAAGKRARFTMSTRLAVKPSRCAIWISWDPAIIPLIGFRFFGDAPGRRFQTLVDGWRVIRVAKRRSVSIIARSPAAVSNR